MLGVRRADDVHLAVPTDDFASVADGFNGCANFHVYTYFLISLILIAELNGAAIIFVMCEFGHRFLN